MTAQEHEGLTLRKTSDGFGPLPKGSEFRAATNDMGRALRMLQREHPSENMMAWDFVVEAA